MYHPQPYDVQNYWAYPGAYPAGAPIYECPPYPIYNPIIASQVLPPITSKPQLPLDTNYPRPSAVSPYVANGPPSESNLEDTSSTRPSSHSPSMASTSDSQIPATSAAASSRPRVVIRVVDPETKEDLTDKLAEMKAQVEEELSKQPIALQQTESVQPTHAGSVPDSLQTQPNVPPLDPHQAVVPVIPYHIPQHQQPPYEPQHPQRRGPNSRGYYHGGPRRGGGPPMRSGGYQQPTPGRHRYRNNPKPLHPREQEIRVNRVPPQVQASKPVNQEEDEEQQVPTEVYKANQMRSSDSASITQTAGDESSNTQEPESTSSTLESEEKGSPQIPYEKEAIEIDELQSSSSPTVQTREEEEQVKILSKESEKVPEVTCILNKDLEIVQLVSDAQVRIEEVTELKTTTIAPSQPEPEQPKLDNKTLSAELIEQSEKMAEVEESSQPTPKDVLATLPKSSTNSVSSSQRLFDKPLAQNAPILPKTATWGNKYKAAIVKPINVIPPIVEKEDKLEAPPTVRSEVQSTPVAPIVTSSDNTTLTTSEGIQMEASVEPQTPKPVAPVLSTWSSRLGANVVNLPSANVQPLPQRPVAPPSSNSNLAQVAPSYGATSADQPAASVQQKPTLVAPNREIEQTEQAASLATSSPWPEQKSEKIESLSSTQEASVSKNDRIEAVSTSEADVDQDGFQEVKQKRKQKPIIPQSNAAGAWGGAQRSVGRSAAPFHQQTAIHGALLSAVPSHEQSGFPDQRSTFGSARSSSNDNQIDDRNPGAFRGRGFGRPPVPRSSRGGWGRGAPRQSGGASNPDVAGSKPSDDTEVVIMKSLQFETSGPSTSENKSSTSCWVDQVEAAKPVNASSWSQIARTRISNASAVPLTKPVTNITTQKPATIQAPEKTPSQQEDLRPEWARVDTKTVSPTPDSLPSPTQKVSQDDEKSTAFCKEETKASSLKDRSPSPIVRGREFVGKETFSKTLETGSTKLPEKVAPPVSVAQPVKPTPVTSVVQPTTRVTSPKRRERDISPPQFSALVSHSDKRVLPSFRSSRGVANERSSRSPSPVGFKDHPGSGSAFAQSTSAMSSVFGNDKGNPPKQRQLAVVNPMKFDD